MQGPPRPRAGRPGYKGGTDRIPDDTYLKGYLNRDDPRGRRKGSPPHDCGVLAMAKIKIENVVASTSLGGELDLQAIALALGGAEYEPEQFPGLLYRLKEPKTAT